MKIHFEFYQTFMKSVQTVRQFSLKNIRKKKVTVLIQMTQLHKCTKNDRTKGQIMSECIYEIIDFPKYHRKNLISALEGFTDQVHVICFDYSQGYSTQVSA